MTDIVKRLREGRTDGSHLRWAVGAEHLEAAEEIISLRAEIERLRAASKWQPIETAPKDGTLILVFREGEQMVAKWHADYKTWGVSPPVTECSVRTFADVGPMRVAEMEVWPGPSKWLPLPSPPTQEGGE